MRAVVDDLKETASKIMSGEAIPSPLSSHSQILAEAFLPMPCAAGSKHAVATYPPVQWCTLPTSGWTPLNAQILLIKLLLIPGGAEKAKERHVAKGKLLVRDRITNLLDPG